MSGCVSVWGTFAHLEGLLYINDDGRGWVAYYFLLTVQIDIFMTDVDTNIMLLLSSLSFF